MKNAFMKPRRDPQGRGWLITINNAETYGFCRTAILAILSAMKLIYWCAVDEIAPSTGTRHTHIYILCHSNTRFSTILRKFPHAHIERARGSAAQNRDYIMKRGKWEDTEKAETSIPGSFEEWGELPQSTGKKNGSAPNLPSMVDTIIDRMAHGESALEILRDNRMMRLGLHRVKEIWEAYLYDKYKSILRTVTVNYLYGETSSGKTSSIYERHGLENVYRITQYRKGGGGVYFERYNGEPVIVFEEFNGQVDVEEMLNYLDCYPIRLPARYVDGTACYNVVYLTSNIPLEQQYRDVQVNRPETWKAFLRRITNVVEYRFEDGKRVRIVHKGVDYTKVKDHEPQKS